MPGRVKAVVSLLLFLFASNLFADCSQWTAKTSSQFRTTAYDLSVDGDFLWLATGYGVQLLKNGSIVDSIALPGSTRIVRANGNGLAYAGSGSQLIVLRRDGRNITRLTTVNVNAAINDIEIVSAALFAATTNGIAHFDLFNPSAPFRTSVILPSSSSNVTSLAFAKTTLYATDGDASVEMYSVAVPTLPQNIGSLTSAPRANAVHATSDELIFVSDRFGQTTDLFSSTIFLERIPLVTTAFAASGDQTHFIAGPDRTVRAVNFSDTDRIAELYAADLALTDGTVNAIQAMAREGETLYIAAGDIGLVTLDTTAIARPYPLVSYSGGATSSVRASGDKAWFSNLAGRITQHRIDSTGIALVEERSWDAEAGSVVRDFRNNGLLTTSGAKATVWSLVSATPVQATTITFGGTIANAVMSDAHVVALLADGTVWAAPNGQSTPTRITVPTMTLLTRAGSAIAMTEVKESEVQTQTVVHYWAAGDLAATSQKFTLSGAASSLALDATRAAIFTINISVVDLATGNVRVIAGSDRIIPKQMTFASDDLLVMDARRLLVYDDARTLLREHALPAEAVAFDAASSIAAIATFKGTAASRYLVDLPQPDAAFASSHYTKMAAARDRVYLMDDEGIDFFSIVTPWAPRFVTTIPAAFDLAASDNALYTLASNGIVTAYSRAGVAFAQADIRDDFNSEMVAIRMAGNTVWAAVANGCTVQGCATRTTYVLDPNTLAVTAALNGNVIDVAVSGTSAYALFSFPDEIRVLNIADPLHPSSIVITAAPEFASSIAYSSGKVYVLAAKVFGYSEPTLAQVEQRLTDVTPNPAHRLRIDGTCALVARGTDAPVLYDLPSWTASSSQFTLPSNLRSFAVRPGMVLLLTEHSLELAYPQTSERVRRRAVR
ncbi:MAG TPA: hypothetical protein VEK79_05885 [Thermoanaerobaculia bacterium]|nr:hypothetical protein [Thermoanaerobaculia bacterium]